MKKTLLLVALAAISFASCKKSETKPDETEELKFSNLSVEENKKSLEQTGIEFTNHINSLPDEKFVGALENFAKINQNANKEIFPFNSLISIASAAKSKNVVNIFNAATNSSKSNKNLSDYYGIYTWNFIKKLWEETSSNSKLEIKFPSSSTSAVNNAVLTASYVASGKSIILDGETYELPSAVTTTLTIDGKEEIKLVSNYQYQGDGSPILVDIKLSFGSFSMSSNITNDGKKAAYSFSFNKGAILLLEAKGGGEGNANVSKVENAENIDDLLYNANSTVSLLDIQFIANVDVKSITSELNKSKNLSQKAYSAKEAELYNKYAEAYAIYKSKKQIIAKLSYESVESSWLYYEWYQNGQWLQNPVAVTYYNYDIEPRLVFKDGSKVDFESFSDTGFSQLTNKLESLSKRIEKIFE